MTSRTSYRFPEQRLTREEALKGTVRFHSLSRAGFLKHRRNDHGLRLGIIQ